MKRILAMLGAFLGGAAMVMQSRVNGELGSRLDSGIVAALFSFSGGLVIIAIAAVSSKKARHGLRRALCAIRAGKLPFWYFGTGLFGAWYVMTQSIAVGLLGVAAFTVGAVSGQTISSLLVDRMGFGVLRARPVTFPRLAGVALAIVAVSLAIISGSSQIGSQIWLLILPFTGGFVQPFQQAMAGTIQFHAREPVTPTLVNFVSGTLALGLICVIAFAGGHRIQPLPGDWWLYIGGIFGVTFIAVAAVAVHQLGTLLMGLLLIAGQVIMALLLDIFLPAAGHTITAWSVASAALTLLAVAVSSIPRRA